MFQEYHDKFMGALTLYFDWKISTQVHIPYSIDKELSGGNSSKHRTHCLLSKKAHYTQFNCSHYYTTEHELIHETWNTEEEYT